MPIGLPGNGASSGRGCPARIDPWWLAVPFAGGDTSVRRMRRSQEDPRTSMVGRRSDSTEPGSARTDSAACRQREEAREEGRGPGRRRGEAGARASTREAGRPRPASLAFFRPLAGASFHRRSRCAAGAPRRSAPIRVLRASACLPSPSGARPSPRAPSRPRGSPASSP